MKPRPEAPLEAGYGLRSKTISFSHSILTIL